MICSRIDTLSFEDEARYYIDQLVKIYLYLCVSRSRQSSVNVVEREAMSHIPMID